jgi:hypothetical protein
VITSASVVLEDSSESGSEVKRLDVGELVSGRTRDRAGYGQ